MALATVPVPAAEPAPCPWADGSPADRFCSMPAAGLRGPHPPDPARLRRAPAPTPAGAGVPVAPAALVLQLQDEPMPVSALTCARADANPPTAGI
ncbi:hypothetical protein FHR36_004596 [Kitasatospora paracochleata]|uniref:Uncharacterized protein n=1 Tax=Kitasatospora paracochleata TaxID=58354 RepID=A0ABT1J224_9ACTN|nr:hypothetical protein [Kitasatospora paracochleata]